MIRYAIPLRCLLFFLVPVLLLAACHQRSQTPAYLAKVPDKKQVYNYFLGQLKQAAKAGGYLKYRLVINNLRIDTAAGNCTTHQNASVTCFTIAINRTEYLDNYTGTYTTTYTGDVYRLYRDENGNLAEAEHTAGAQNTVQDHHPNTSNTL